MSFYLEYHRDFAELIFDTFYHDTLAKGVLEYWSNGVMEKKAYHDLSFEWFKINIDLERSR